MAKSLGFDPLPVVVGRPNAPDGALRAKLQGAGHLLVEIGGLSPALFHAAGLAEGLGAKVAYMGPSEAGFPFLDRAAELFVHGGDLECLRAELPRFLQTAFHGAAPAPATQTDAPSAAPAPPPVATDRFTAIFGEILRQHGHTHQGAVEEEDPKTFILHDQTMDLALVQDLARKARALGLRLKLM